MSSPTAASPTPSQLRPLSLQPLVPEKLSSHGHVFTALKKIDAIRVVRNPDRQSRRKYVVEVFSGRPSSRIPSAGGPIASISAPPGIGGPAPSRPTTTIAKSLDDFVDLRSNLYYLAHDAHSDTPCSFCHDMVEYALWGNLQPNAVARMLRDDEATLQSLTKFVGDLVPMVESGCWTPNSPSRCRAQAKIPRLVQTFLYGPSSE